MSIHALKIEDDGEDGVLIIHRAYPGDHVFDGDSCWCRPVVDSVLKSSEEIVEKLESCDG